MDLISFLVGALLALVWVPREQRMRDLALAGLALALVVVWLVVEPVEPVQVVESEVCSVPSVAGPLAAGDSVPSVVRQLMLA